MLRVMMSSSNTASSIRAIAKQALRLLFLFSAVTAVVTVLTAAGDQMARFNELGHKKLICVCGCGQILLECNHVGCQYSDGMRNELMTAVNRGDSDNLVLQAFVQEYGPTVLAAPPATGFSQTAWTVPFLALAVGIIAVVLVVRAWKNKPAPAIAGGLRTSPGMELDQFREQARRETEL